MKVIVDTSIWSLALRRDKTGPHSSVMKLRNLIGDHRVQMLGPIRQEILSGIRSEAQFQKVRDHLASFPDFPLISEDYETAAVYFNQCRSKGIQGLNTDFLICAASVRGEFSIFTLDRDFALYSQYLPITLC